MKLQKKKMFRELGSMILKRNGIKSDLKISPNCLKAYKLQFPVDF